MRRRLFILFTTVTAILSGPWVIAETPPTPTQTPIVDMGCGTYRVAGHFAINSNGLFVLTVNFASLSPIEFLVTGGDRDKLRFINKTVMAEFYSPHPIKASSSENVVFLQSISSAEDPAAKQQINLLKKRKLRAA